MMSEFMEKNSLIKDAWNFIKLPLVGIVLIGGFTRGCNALFNNREVSNEKYNLISKSTGIFGHEEYIRFDDNSAQAKVYPDFLGHRYASSKLYEDLNGDKITDRIRINGPEWKFHKLQDILIREKDYASHKKEFEKGDELFKKY